MKVAVYTIALNEEKHVERWFESAKEADYLLIADTGSTDKTIEIAKNLGINVYQINVTPWRFDDSRNTALSLLPSDIDYCVSLDMDEVLEFGWREELEKAYEQKATIVMASLSYSYDEQGNPASVFGAKRIHARKDYRWIYPIHEVIAYVGKAEIVHWSNILIKHLPDNSKSRGQYLSLLETAAKENPTDSRCSFYYARELFFHQLYEMASNEFKRFLALPSSVWEPERASARRYLARCEPDIGVFHLNKALEEDPTRRETYVDMAQRHYENEEWQQCYDMAMKALSITEQPLDYFCEGYAWTWLPHDLASISAWHLGKKDESIEQEKKALEFAPNDRRMLDNLAFLLRDRYPEKVTAIIPSKSNFSGALQLIEELEKDPQVEEIILIADGEESYKKYEEILAEKKNIVLEKVELGVGIHVMWNIGIDYALKSGNTAAFLNDDVIPYTPACGTLASFLEYDKSYGLVCPNYDERQFSSLGVETALTQMGKNDGTGGLAGSFMLLHKDLVKDWKFDERMKWWYGDDDVIQWTWRVANKKVSIINLARCAGNDSWTSRKDPPNNFAQLVQEDKKVFYEKWGTRL